jgi:hypothetical protein
MLQKHLVIVRRNEDVLSVDRVCEFGGGRMMTDVIGRWLAAGLVAVVALGPTAVGAQSIRAVPLSGRSPRVEAPACRITPSRP